MLLKNPAAPPQILSGQAAIPSQPSVLPQYFGLQQGFGPHHSATPAPQVPAQLVVPSQAQVPAPGLSVQPQHTNPIPGPSHPITSTRPGMTAAHGGYDPRAYYRVIQSPSVRSVQLANTQNVQVAPLPSNDIIQQRVGLVGHGGELTALGPGEALGRKRARHNSPNDQEEDLATSSHPARASLLTHTGTTLVSSLNTAAQGIPHVATQALARPRTPEGALQSGSSVVKGSAKEAETTEQRSSNEKATNTEDKDVHELLEELYSADEQPEHWKRMYYLIDRVLSKQESISKTVEQLKQVDDSTQAKEPVLKKRAGVYTSPPEPPKDPVWDQTVPCLLPAGRQARAVRHNMLLGLVREMILLLLQLPCFKRGTLLPAPPPASVRAPTRERYHIRWYETEKSPFNQAAAAILLQEIIQSGVQLTAEELRELPKMIEQHIRYLYRRYKNENRDDAEEFNAWRLKRCSADSRKRRLFENRLRVVDRFQKSLGKHRLLLVHLDVAGMSSDEEDEEHPGVYKIRQRHELSTRVTQLKRNLDHVYALYFKGPGSKGSQLHMRVPSELKASRRFNITGLPITCMSRAWLADLGDADKEYYRFIPHQYDYSFPAELFFPYGGAQDDSEMVLDES
ncbi:hypothetical protein FRC11_006760 [Ceratobasidium sp. 423]|nr:hypothetical protein FRC11_006760 [Ceratobasidium sp. 423]